MDLSKGVSLYLAIVVLSILTATLLSLLAITLAQTKTINSLSDSVVAFYASDTGIERVLYRVFMEGWTPVVGEDGRCVDFSQPCNLAACNTTCALTGCGEESLINFAKYEVCVAPCVPAGACTPTTLWSTGVYNGTSRKIEIKF